EERIVGVMIESNLVGGRQDLVPGKPLQYGQSITDGCIGWETSEAVLERLANSVKASRVNRVTRGTWQGLAATMACHAGHARLVAVALAARSRASAGRVASMHHCCFPQDKVSNYSSGVLELMVNP